MGKGEAFVGLTESYAAGIFRDVDNWPETDRHTPW